MTTLKRGSLYVLPLTARTEKPRPGTFPGTSSPTTVFATRRSARMGRPFTSPPIREDSRESVAGGTTSRMQDPGAILAFTYTGEGTGKEAEEPEPVTKAKRQPSETPLQPSLDGIPPAVHGGPSRGKKTAYNSDCASVMAAP